ncbi:hypothetical protein BMS3Bbin15_00581 [archaeon BMS3Bbin15]|nr:hypothetical protein BMS3Bbin15_00581 [archaeon BMS3Bbin15]
MQQLLVEFKNTSGNAPQVPCSVSGALNRDKSLSVPGIMGILQSIIELS